MRATFTVLIVLTVLNLSYGQEQILYIDFCENFVSEDNYDIKRVIKNHPERKFQYIVYDYYKNGQLLTTGLSKSRNGKVRDGEFIFFHPNGEKMALGSLEKSFKKGKWLYWDNRGMEIEKDSLISHMRAITLKDDTTLHKGRCLCYFKEATWTKTNTITNQTTEYEFSDGNQIAINGLYSTIDDTATYKTGFDEFYKYIEQELTYPFITRLRGKHGRVLVSFTIDKNGNLLNTVFLVSLDKPTERKIRDILAATSGNWKPAVYKGKSVSSTLVLPVIFKLK